MLLLTILAGTFARFSFCTAKNLQQFPNVRVALSPEPSEFPPEHT